MSIISLIAPEGTGDSIDRIRQRGLVRVSKIIINQRISIDLVWQKVSEPILLSVSSGQAQAARQTYKTGI